MRRRTPIIATAVALAALTAAARAADAQEIDPNAETGILEAEGRSEKRELEEALRLRQKDIDRGRAYEAPGASSYYGLIGHDAEVRDAYYRIANGYQAAIEKGAPLDHPRVAAVRRHRDAMRAKVEAAGVFLATQSDDPPFRQFADPDDVAASRRQRDEREIFERTYIGDLHTAFDHAHDGHLRLTRENDVDAAVECLEKARRELDPSRFVDGLPGVERHPAWARTRDAIESRFAPAIEAAEKKTAADREAARAAVAELSGGRSAVERFVQSHGRTPTEPAARRERLAEVERFERNELPKLIGAIERFEATYGKDGDAVDARFEKIWGGRRLADRPTSPSSALADAYEAGEAIVKLRADHAATIMSGVATTVSLIEEYNPDIQVETLESTIPEVELALRFDPENAEAKALAPRLEGMTADLADAFVERAKSARMPERSYSGGDAAAIEAAIVDYFREDDGWGAASEHASEPLGAVLTSDWLVSSTNILGEPLNYEVETAVVFQRSTADGWERDHCVVFAMTMYTLSGREAARQGPPFEAVSIGEKTEILRENLPSDVGGGSGGEAFSLLFSCFAFVLLLGATAGTGLLFYRIAT